MGGNTVRAPHPALREYVDPYVGYLHDEGSPGEHRGVPSGRLTMIVAFDEPIDLAWHDRPGQRRRFWTLASGMHSQPVHIHHSGLQHGVQVSLTPRGCRTLLGVPAHALARELVDLAEVLDLRYDELPGASWDDRFAALDDAFLAALDDRHEPDPTLVRAWDVVERSRGTVRVADLANDVGWSRRRLSTRFHDEFGLTPKEATRVVRFEHSRRLVRSGVTLAEAAVVSGYADQPHLTREWHALTGWPPAEYLRREFPDLQDRTVPVGAASSS